VIQFWGPESGKEVRRITGSPGKHEWGRSLAYPPDGKTLAVGGQGTGAPEVWLLDPSTGKVRRRLGEAEGKDSLHCLAISGPDGRRLASGGRGTVRLWDVGAGKELRKLDFGGELRSLAFSPGGRMLAAGGGGVCVWDVATGRRVARFTGHRGMVQAVAFSPRRRAAGRRRAGYDGARLEGAGPGGQVVARSGALLPSIGTGLPLQCDACRRHSTQLQLLNFSPALIF
jgi:WD40 repeat protein